MIVSRKTVFAVLAILLAVVAGGWYFRGSDDKPTKPKAKPLVSVALARTVDLPVRLESHGHLVALKRVDIRAQVTARIRKIHFREGDEIRAGQLLFTLDDAELSAQLERARAEGTQIRAQLEEAQRALERGNELVGTGYISSSALDTLRANVQTLEAQRRAGYADIDAARVQVDYARITAPMDARAGELSLHEGSLVQANNTPLVSLLQFDPMGAEFTLPEQYLGAVLNAREHGQTKVSVQTSDGQWREGELTFIDNTVNTTTGTIQLKAQFPNPDHHLWPGSFAKIELLAGHDKGVIVLPPQAVLEGPSGHFVYRIDADHKVQEQAVELLRIQENMAVVAGIVDGEQVVVEGNLNLRSGREVEIVTSR